VAQPSAHGLAADHQLLCLEPGVWDAQRRGGLRVRGQPDHHLLRGRGQRLGRRRDAVPQRPAHPSQCRFKTLTSALTLANAAVVSGGSANVIATGATSSSTVTFAAESFPLVVQPTSR